MTSIRDARRRLKSDKTTQYHPSVWLDMDETIFDYTLTKLYKNAKEYSNLNDLLGSLVDTNSLEFMKNVRREIAKHIKGLSDSKFEKLLFEFNEQSSQRLRTRDGVCKYIKSMTTDYDEWLIPFVEKVLNLDILLLKKDDTSLELKNYTDSDYIQDNVVLVLCEFGKYSILSFKDNQIMKDVYSRKSLPREVDHLIDKHNYFQSLIKTILEISPKITLKDLYQALISRLGVMKLTREHKRLINRITHVLLENIEFTESVKKI